MNVADLAKLVARRWIVILAFVIGGAFLAFFAVYKVGSGGITPRKVGYTSSATLLIDQPGVQGAGASAALGRLLLLPSSFKLVLESQEIADGASEIVGGAYTPEEIVECTTAENVIGTQVMEVTSCADNPNDTVQVTQAVVDSFQQWLKSRQDQANVLGPNRIVASMISAPQVPTKASGFPPTIWIMLGTVFGLVFGLLTAIGIESVKSENEAPIQAVPQIGTDPSAVGSPQVAASGDLTLPAVQNPTRTRRSRRY